MTSDLPTISVVIPARNEELLVRESLESVAAQEYPRDHIQCVVVDNGSDDRTAAMARMFAGKHSHPRVTVISDGQAGVARAKNLGASAADGEILIFLDADSRMHPRLAADVVAHLRSGSPAGSIRIMADSHHPVERGFFALMEIGKICFGVRGQMLYCTSELFRTLRGFDTSLRLAEDLEFLDRLRERVKEQHLGTICHIRTSWIYTSPRRMRRYPYHLGVIPMFCRWLLAFAGIGRSRGY